MQPSRVCARPITKKSCVLPALFALEPKILIFLHDVLQASVPSVLAENTKLDCFLMRCAGNNLRTRLKKQFDEDLVCRTMQQFVDFQIQAADYVDDLIAMGVPDYRLEHLPGLYDALVTEKDLLIEEGFSETEITKFQRQ